MRIGVHTSIAGGLENSLARAHKLGCNTMQIFSGSPRVWASREPADDDITAFRKSRLEYGISPVFIHCSYLINLATSKPELRSKSIAMLIRDMNRADALKADYVVIHTGSASGEDPKAARGKAISCLNEIASMGKWDAGILLENTAGERGDITSRMEDLSEIADRVSDDLISGICLDTCHAFAAGYDIRNHAGAESLANDITGYIGAGRLRLIHLNDSKGELGSGVDRHEHIGIGKIGLEGFRTLLSLSVFKEIPLILETPKKTDEDDPRNLKIVRELVK